MRGAGCFRGRIERGVADRIGAVLWFSDLRHFTQVADKVEPELLIPFLNDYADAIISSIHEAGGDVLKLWGRDARRLPGRRGSGGLPVRWGRA
jgi:adenylate cyclase